MIRRGQAFGTGRTATITVAASNSQQASGRQADYKCDGENDQEVIQEAIDSLGAEGGKVLLMEGNYIVTGEILMRSNLVFEGVGWSTKIKLRDNTITTPHIGGIRQLVMILGATHDAAPLHNLIIRNLMVDGNTVNQHPNSYIIGIDAGTTNYLGVHNNFVTNCFTAIAGNSYVPLDTPLVRFSHFGVFSNNIIKNSCPGDGIGLNFAKYCIIEHNILEKAEEGIDLKWCAHCSVNNNIDFSLGSQKAVALELSNSQHCVIQGNIAQAVPTMGSGIRISTIPVWETLFPDTRNNIISNNYISDYLTGVSFGNKVYENKIINNTFHGNTTFNVLPMGTNIIRNNHGQLITENSGTAIFSGTGTAKTFTIPHGLIAGPSQVSLEARSTDAAGDKFWTADATNIIVTFITAPPAGTNNVFISWKAEAR